MDPIYTVEVRRMQVWVYRIRAEDDAAAKEIGERLSESDGPSDDYGYEISARLSKNQVVRAENDDDE